MADSWMNLALFLAEILVSCGALLAFLRFFGKAGTYAFIALATVVANLQVSEIVPAFCFDATLGNAFYSSVFLASDILSEKYSAAAAKRGVWLGFAASALFSAASALTLLYRPSPADCMRGHLAEVLGVMPRIFAASVAAYLASSLLDVALFSRIRRKFPKHAVTGNVTSTLVAQFVDSAVFTAAAFTGRVGTGTLASLMFTTYALKVACALPAAGFFRAALWISPAE